MSAEQRLKELGIALPAPPQAAGTYIAGVQAGNLLFMSGCGPRRPRAPSRYGAFYLLALAVPQWQE